MTSNQKDVVSRISTIEEDLKTHVFVERDLEIHGMFLAIVANTNILFLGEPGVAKSLLATEVLKHINDSKYFEWLLTPFTTPDEIAGNISLKALGEDRYKRNIENTINDAHIAFLDEVWKGNGGVLNFLLPLLNERVYYNDGKRCKSPLLTVIGASNELPEDEDHLDAALDRFVLKFNVDTIKEKSNMLVMMQNYLAMDPERDRLQVTISEIKDLQKAAKAVKIPKGILKLVITIKSKLEKSQVYVSPRVLNNSLRVIQASAILNGRDVAAEDDVEVLRHTFWKQPEHESIIYQEVLSRISPDKKKLEEEFAKAESVYNEYRKADEDSEEDIQTHITCLQSLRKVKNSIERTARDIKEKGKDTALAERYLGTIKTYIEEILEAQGLFNK